MFGSINVKKVGKGIKTNKIVLKYYITLLFTKIKVGMLFVWLTQNLFPIKIAYHNIIGTTVRIGFHKVQFYITVIIVD